MTQTWYTLLVATLAVTHAAGSRSRQNGTVVTTGADGTDADSIEAQNAALHSVNDAAASGAFTTATATPTPTPFEENFDCPRSCLNRGACVGGMCYCLFPYTGPDCQDLLCEKPCQNGGTCNNGTCLCPYGFHGPTCREQDCSHLYNCNDQGECSHGICTCYPGYFGADCSKQSCPFDCYGHGECDQIQGKPKCRCDKGWTGELCNAPKCLNGCNSNGVCVDGICQCYPGYSGADCQVLKCDICDHGNCVAGVCQCDDGWEGPGCEHEICPENCNGNGVCVEGACVCNPGWDGHTCTEKYCPLKCNFRGECVDGHCVCNKGYQGVACGVIECPGGCQDHGKCVSGFCQCYQGYEGLNCEIHICPGRCSGHGTCQDMVCTCDDMYYGFDCSRKECPDHCSGHGQCAEGECHCYRGWTEENCAERRCKNDCNGNGICNNGVCECLSSWRGEDCSQRQCIDECNYRGKCIQGFCECQPMYNGAACENLRCINDCSGNGVCNQTTVKCECEGYWFGADCSNLGCPDDCNHRGSCDDGFCSCYNGYSGNACQYKACPNQCNKKGDCNRLKGECECYEGWGEVDCSRRTCPEDCNGRAAACLDGICKCKYGWEGRTCETKSCLDGCDQGTCINGDCVCDPGWGGKACRYRVCPDDCSGHGICDTNSGTCGCDAGWWKPNCGERDCVFGCINGECNDGDCNCFFGWGGVACDSKGCPNDCNNHGTCKDAMCTCDEGWKGEDCSVKSCKFDCHDQGACLDGKCECYMGFEGDTCEFKKCPADCNFRGSCNKYTGQCTCMQIWKGSACELPNCPATTMGDCHGHGVCKIGGYCECDAHWRGDKCDLLKCPKDCHLHGMCGNGTCSCYEGYFGVPCDRECPKNCSSGGRRNGQCIDEQCVCDYWHFGRDCSEICDKNCTARGECMEDENGHGYCDCEYGFTGQWCEQIQPCPGTPECNAHGTCSLARCTCDEGWGKYHNNGFEDMAEVTSFDNDCSEKLCLNACSRRGVCEAGACLCREGYSGEDCSYTGCLNDCSDHGTCKQPQGVCECFPGYLGADCSIDECPNACSGHGTCDNKCCTCDEGYMGVDCSLKKCPMDCSNRGSCDYLLGSCTCFPPYYGVGCEKVLPVRDIVTGTEEVAFGYQPEQIQHMSYEQVKQEAMKHIVDRMTKTELADQIQQRLVDAIKDDPAALIAELKKRAGVATAGLQAQLKMSISMGTAGEPTDGDLSALKEQIAIKAGVDVEQVVFDVVPAARALSKANNLLQGSPDYVVKISITGLTSVTAVADLGTQSAFEQMVSDAGISSMTVNNITPPEVAPVKGAVANAPKRWTDAELSQMTAAQLVEALQQAFAAMTTEEMYSTVAGVYMAMSEADLKDLVTQVATSEYGNVEYVEPYLVFGRVQVGSEFPKGCEVWKEETSPAIVRVMEMIAGVPAEDIKVTDTACHEAKVIIEYSVAGVTEDAATQIASKLLVGFQMGKFMWFMSNEGHTFMSYKMVADPLVVAPDELEGDSPFDKLYLGPKVNPRLPIEEPPMPAGELEAEVRSAISMSMVCDMPYTTMTEWRADYESILKMAVAKFIPIEDGLHRVRVERVERGSTIVNKRAAQLKVIILPPTEVGTTPENSMEEKMKLDAGLKSGDFADMVRKMGIPCLDIVPLSVTVETKTITDIKGRCTRCRSGREQSESDHREFTRKCSADGSCKRQTPFTVDNACAHGCADHCASTCKRFHVTKEKVCMSRRRMHQAAEALKPSSEPVALLQTEVAEPEAPSVLQAIMGRPPSAMKQSIAAHVGANNFLAQESEATANDNSTALPSELKVISTCFAECAQSCIEHCIGQWSDAIPKPEHIATALAEAEKEQEINEAKEEDAERLVQTEAGQKEAAMLSSNR